MNTKSLFTKPDTHVSVAKSTRKEIISWLEEHVGKHWEHSNQPTYWIGEGWVLYPIRNSSSYLDLGYTSPENEVREYVILIDGEHSEEATMAKLKWI